MLQEIKTIQDVVTFIEDIAREIGDYNPFRPFTDYIDAVTGKPKYTPQEAALRDRLLERCFEVCAQQSDNFIYLSLVIFEESRDIIAYMQGSTAIVEPQTVKP